MQGDGLYKSADAGKTWAHVGLGQHPRRSRAMRVHPTNPDLVYAAASSVMPYAESDERGVFKLDRRRRDVGEACCTRCPKSRRASTCRSTPTTPSVMFAALWESVAHAALDA
jgi:hypothetical protein